MPPKPNLAAEELDPVELYQKLLKLKDIHKMYKNWEDTKKPVIREYTDKRNASLLSKTRNIHNIIREKKYSKPERLVEFLKRDKELYEISKSKDTPDIIPALENIIFTKRKFIDKLTNELVNLKEEYYNLQKQIWFVKSRKGRAHKEVKKHTFNLQDKEVELENIKTERDAGIIALNSYKKLLDLLHKESTHFDTISNRLKGVVILRAQYLLHLLNILNWCTSDVKALTEMDKVLLYIQSNIALKQGKDMRKLKNEFMQFRDLIIPFEGETIQQKAPDVSVIQRNQMSQYAETVQHIEDRWDEAFEKLRNICCVTEDRHIIPSIENAMQDQAYLLKIIEINNLLLDNYSKRRNYLQQTLDQLIYTTPGYVREFREKKAKLLEENKVLEDELAVLNERAKEIPKNILDYYTTMFYLQEALKNIGIQPYETLKRTQDTYRAFDQTLHGDGEDSNVVITDVTEGNNNANPVQSDLVAYDDKHYVVSQRHRKFEIPEDYTDPYVPPHKFDYLDDEYRISHVFDAIFLKVKLMLQQLGNKPEVLSEPPTEEMKAAYRHYLSHNSDYQTEDRQCIDSDFEEEEEGEGDEMRELERVLYSMWAKGGKVEK
ncbi:hypothetical protein O3M35_001391 [Rhynocoris fuscipes]|uniref:Uncharacterized protein n=1 Tax=Rhynocoris fuscipes TaxID=488301 RepID=A0AAW1CRD7_9HEMI